MASFADALAGAVNQQCTHLTNTSPNTREANERDLAFARGHELLGAAKQGHSDSGAGISGGQ